MAVTIDDFKTAFDTVPLPALIIDCDLTIIACNIAYEQAGHVNRSMMLGRPLFDVFPGSSIQQTDILRESFAQVLKSGKPHHIPYATTMLGAPGFEDRSWTTSNIPLFRSDGTIRCILHCPIDITELIQLRQPAESGARTETSILSWARNVETSLSSELEHLQQLFQQAPGFICVLQGPQHNFELANDAYYQLVGHREIIGRALAGVLPEVVAQGFLDKLDRVYATGEPFIGRAMPILLQRTADGTLEQRYIDLTYQPMFDADRNVSGIFVQGNDVTEAHLLAQEITHQAAHDPLTGLYNRREFTRQTLKIDGPGPHALFYMDIDHFKIINDRCGHAAGDALLLQVADSLKEGCESDHDLLARLGGDEFGLLRRNCSLGEAIELANSLRMAVKDIHFIWQGKRYGITLSVGLIGFSEAEGMFFESVLGLADAACFLAKEKGRNRVQVSSPTDDEVKQQQHDMDSVSRLKDAMREDRIVLYGQKIIGLHANPKDCQVFYEVLARLRDYDGTIIAPGAFIPAAERFGLIEELDRHIVRKSFAHVQAQPAERHGETCYFINLSGITLSAPGFSDFIESALAAYPAVCSSQICFEVTETAAISNVKRTAEGMRRLIEKGFSFALDDFGSGMASFSYLRHLPVQYIKIDGEFIKSILTHPLSAILVEAVAKIARTMNVRTIAESVEFDELVPPLRSLGIDYGQGYALHRPEPLI